MSGRTVRAEPRSWWKEALYPPVGAKAVDCQMCRGTGWQVMEQDEVRVARPCPCVRRNSEHYWVRQVGLPEEYWAAGLEEDIQRLELSQRQCIKLRHYVQHYPLVSKVVVIVGDAVFCAGRIAALLLKEVGHRQHLTVRYISPEERPSRLRTLFSQQEQEERQREALSADVTAIDGWLRGENSAAMQDEIWNVMGHRFAQHQPLILSCRQDQLGWLQQVLLGSGKLPAEISPDLLREMLQNAEWLWLAPSLRRTPWGIERSMRQAVA